MIRLTGISKTFKDKTAVDFSTLSIDDGQTTVLIGPSGCGKSTILRLIVGLVNPSTGLIYFDDQQVNPQTITVLRRNIGYVIQDGGLFPHLTAHHNLSLLPHFLSYSSQFIENRIKELCELVQLPVKLLQAFPLQLSGGERQRVSLMRALMLDPKYVLLDEPLAALDPITRFELQQQLRNIFSQLKKTVLLVTHDMREASFLGDEIILMRNGKVVQKGTFQNLLKHPDELFVTQFIQAQQYPSMDNLE